LINSDHTKVRVLSSEQIQTRVKELAEQISAELGENPVLLGVLKGAFVFLSDLARYMTVPAQVDFVRLASYGSSHVSLGTITMSKPPELDLRERTVVAVEDIVDTGRTLSRLVDYLGRAGCARVKLCAFIDKPERREVNLLIDYVGFYVPQGFLVGYGMDYNESYRCLPSVFELKI
jgi:hypoxanthine phosphoribosyltransferase